MRNRWLCPQLNWPSDVFAEANMAASRAAALKERDNVRVAEHLCRCGCKLPHNNAVPRLFLDQGDRQILWYRNADHRNRHVSREWVHD